VFGRRFLQDGKRGDQPVGVRLDFGPERVDAGAFEPFLRPRRQITTGRRFKCTQQVLQGAVVPRMGFEIVTQARKERLAAHPGDQLLEDGGALGIGDAVEVGLDRVDVDDVSRDRVRRRQLVLPARPGLLFVRERGPGLRPSGRLDLRQVRHVRGEGLVEPQVVPPPHRDEIAEPHVRHLVQDRARAALESCVGDARAENVVFEERDRACVFHRPGVELGHEELVVFLEGVRPLEDSLEETESLLGDRENLVGVEVFGE
jgi:hypothetical protein